MKKDLDKTPRSRVTQALRQVWLRSRERASALKKAKYSCNKCGVKQSKKDGKEQKVVVHHKIPIDQAWDEIIDLVFKHILIHPDGLEVLCPDCHKKEHKKKNTS